MRGRTLTLLVLVALATPGSASSSGERVPTKRVATYCSRTGDLCFGIFRKQGAIFFDITTAARYFNRYRLCVRGPSETEACRSFPIRRYGMTFDSSVRWNTNFPREGPGRYRVAWKVGTQPLGPVLRFSLG